MELNYQISYREWVNACQIYSESIGPIRIALKTLTIFAYFFIPLFLVIGFEEGFTIRDSIFTFFIILWLFFRKKLNKKLIEYRLNKQKLDHKEVHLAFSENGIIWSVKGFPEAKMSWDRVRTIVEIKNGFFIPDKQYRFVYVPSAAFSEAQLKQFQFLLTKHKIKVKHFLKWSC